MRIRVHDEFGWCVDSGVEGEGAALDERSLRLRRMGGRGRGRHGSGWEVEYAYNYSTNVAVMRM